MTHPEHDTDFDAWLRRSSSLHAELTKLDRSDPPEELDRIVLERARDAIRSPRPVSPLRQMRWALPVGVAATLIISFALLVQIGPNPVDTRSGPASVPPSRAEGGSAAPQAYESAHDQTASEPNVMSRPIEVAPPVARVRETDAPTRAADVPAREPSAPQAAAKREYSVPAAPVAQRALESERGSVAKTEARRDAATWLAEIEALRAKGRIAEAERELAEFRRVYPDRSGIPAGAARPDER